MVKIIVSTDKKIVATFTKGIVQAIIYSKSAFAIRVNALQGVSASDLVDYADAIRKVCKKVGAVVDKTVSLRGTRIDPDEPAVESGKDVTVTYQIFPKDKRFKLSFTRYAEDGRVKASVKDFAFTDIPSAVQVAFVAEQASNLMKEYAEIVE